MAVLSGTPRCPSLAALVGELETYGLSREVLVFWLALCRSHTTGSLTFHHFQGRIEVYEPHYRKHLTAGEEHLPRL